VIPPTNPPDGDPPPSFPTLAGEQIVTRVIASALNKKYHRDGTSTLDSSELEQKESVKKKCSFDAEVDRQQIEFEALKNKKGLKHASDLLGE
jgi:hypothetical protein